MNSKNQRKLFYEKKILILFSAYLLLTLVLILGLAGQLLTQISFSFASPGLTDSLVWNPKLLLVIFLIWSVYGYFFAYFYARQQIQGLVLRMGHIFEQVASGESKKLTFRKNDPFHAVSKSFDALVSQVHQAHHLKDKLKTIAHKADSTTKQKLEELIQKL